MKIRYIALLLLPAIISLCGAGFGPQIVRGPMPSVTAGPTGVNDPTNTVATVIAWYAPTNCTINANNQITKFVDMSGNGYDAINTQYTGPFLSNTVALRCAWFHTTAGTCGGLTNNVPGVAQPNTVLAVACPINETTRGSPYDYKLWDYSGANNVQFAFELEPGSAARAVFAYAGTGLASANYTMDTLTNKWTIYSVFYNGANSWVRTNGALLVSGNMGANGWANPGGMALGGKDPLRFYRGGIREVIWVGTCTSNQLFTLERNLARKWGITNSIVPGD